MLVVMSPASQNSDRVRGEIMFAHRIGRPIIPLLLAGRPFFSQGGAAPENVIGGELPDDSVIDRLGELSQTPITHRRSGKPGRGSASRERDSLTATGTALLAPMRTPHGPVGRPHRLYSEAGPDPDDFDPDDDDRRRRFRPAVLATAATVVTLVIGVVVGVLLVGPGSQDQPTTPLGASNVRPNPTAPTQTSGAAAPVPSASASPSASGTTSKKPTTSAKTTTTTPVTTTTTTATTPPPPIPGFSLSLGASSIPVNTTTTATITLDSAYAPSSLSASLGQTGDVVTVPGSTSVAANSTTVMFTVTAGATAGSGTVTATINGVTHSAPVSVTDAPTP
jgi:hypothetical protein